MRKGVGTGRQYIANFFPPKRNAEETIHLINFANQVTNSKKLAGAQAVDKIFASERAAPAYFGRDHGRYIPLKNFKKLPRYEGEPMMGEAINDGYGLDVLQRVPCRAKGLATSILYDVLEMHHQN